MVGIVPYQPSSTRVLIVPHSGVFPPKRPRAENSLQLEGHCVELLAELAWHNICTWNICALLPCIGRIPDTLPAWCKTIISIPHASAYIPLQCCKFQIELRSPNSTESCSPPSVGLGGSGWVEWVPGSILNIQARGSNPKPNQKARDTDHGVFQACTKRSESLGLKSEYIPG